MTEILAPGMSRRTLLRAGTVSVASLFLPSTAIAGGGLVDAAWGVNPALLHRTLLALARHDNAIWSRDVVAIVDFSLPSAQPRFHLVDLLAGTTTTLLVAHGKGSDPDHSGYLQSFSDVEGSNASSEGAYLVDEAYTGIHGPSRRLIGLDATNGHAMDRAIVIHAAWYANADMIQRQGRLGRSDGCFAVPEHDIGLVLSRLGRGRLLYAGKT